jgi:hypothetical protein
MASSRAIFDDTDDFLPLSPRVTGSRPLQSLTLAAIEKFLRLPEPAAENAGKPQSRRQRVLLRQKNVPHGDDGWREFVRSLDPAADLAARAPLRLLPPHPSHPIMRRPDADLEEKREPRVALSAGAQKGDSIKSSDRSLTLAAIEKRPSPGWAARRKMRRSRTLARAHCHINELSLRSFLQVPRFRGKTIGTPCVSRSRAARHRPSQHTLTA